MARIRQTPRFPMGTRVIKSFPGYAEPFIGIVDGFAMDSGYYHIQYDDGDSEEMTEEDVERYYYTKPGKTNKSAKPAKPTKSAPKLTTKNATKKKPRTKMLLLSSSAMQDAVDDHEEEEGVQEEDGAEDGEEEEEEVAQVQEVTQADAIYKLVGQRVCKRQPGPDGAIVNGTVSSYFPATQRYRVVYTNGTTDDMTYREVVDSIPLSASTTGAVAKKKRKSSGETSVETDRGAGTRVQSPKKQKMVEMHVPKERANTDENVNSENTTDADESREKPATKPSVFVLPTQTEDSFVWNRAAAYDTVRSVLYVVVSTTKEVSEPVKALEQPDIKSKTALKKFISCGGLVTLHERLGLWCKSKETEPGVKAILKVLAVMPGVTKDAVLSSNIGITLSNIRKRKPDYVSPNPDPIITDMASYVIKKWRRELSDTGEASDKKKTSKGNNETKTKMTSSSTISKQTKAGNRTTEPSSNGTASLKHKRSNSAGHLRDLIGGPRGNQARNTDTLGSSLNNGRPGSRPLGAPHARSARRSTVLLDSIMNRLKTTESERPSPTAENQTSLKADAWTASRVKFGGHSTLEFDNEIEVSMLLVAPVPGGIRPFRPKNAPPVMPPPLDKQPSKSILRVKLAEAEREANAALLRSEERHSLQIADTERPDRTERIIVGSVTFTEVSSGGHPVRPSIGNDKSRESEETEANGDRDDDDGDVSMVVAPPSPPRKHDASEDDDDVAAEDEGDLIPLPDDIVIGEVPSPPSSDIPEDQAMDVVESTGVDVEMDEANTVKTAAAVHATTKPIQTERVPSPEVSSDSSSAESGEISEEDEEPAHPSPLLASLSHPSTPMPSPPPPQDVPSMGDATKAMDSNPTTEAPQEAPSS